MVFKFDPNSTVNEGRWRLRDPETFVNTSYIRKNFSNDENKNIIKKDFFSDVIL